MLEALGNVLGNAHFEAYVGGPLVGFIVAVIFSSLGKRLPPDSGISRKSPKEIWDRLERPTRDIHHHHYHAPQSSKSNGSSGELLIFGGIFLLVVLFLFSAFLPQIANLLSFFILAVAMFSVTASILAVVTGQFTNQQWWLHAIFPSLVSIICFWLTDMAYRAINPTVVKYAHDLLDNGPLSLNLVLTGAFSFFKALGNEYVSWLLFDMTAFLCILICSVISLLQCVFYVSLSNTRNADGRFWMRLALITERFSTIGNTFFVIFFLGLGWAFSSGYLYKLIH
ncbi:hypothetical protein [Herbaspirillum sp. RV1423]|uniref:hypothetical protein n=1 Tax=Herbaspirillum sp. RV1423 TaxID=1443993 RepID=UPI001E53E54D|nr:hypothetical protein [Herbaspirillum sp. RV1423]